MSVDILAIFSALFVFLQVDVREMETILLHCLSVVVNASMNLKVKTKLKARILTKSIFYFDQNWEKFKLFFQSLSAQIFVNIELIRLLLIFLKFKFHFKGTCSGTFHRFGYETLANRCTRFVYGGCGGNGFLKFLFLK